MPKDIVMSINPTWIQKIFTGEKTYEVRRRAPLQCSPFKVYVYCTKGEEAWLAGIKGGRKSYKLNGNIVGEFTCERIYDIRPPFKDRTHGTCLSPKELYEYLGDRDHLDYLTIKDPVIYDKPKKLEDFGLTRPPQSWCYIKDEKRI